jgi:hypothetical protein
MKKMKLSNGKFAIVDNADFEWLNQWKWSATENGSSWYARRQEGGRKHNVKIYMHRFILGILDSPKVIADHINRNGLDNRRSNLRKCTKAQNNSYRIPTTNRTSKYMGVCKSTDSNKKPWRAYIRPSTGQICRYFNKEVDAAKWYNAMAKQIFGDFAYQNPV